jgi:hypothetical protein
MFTATLPLFAVQNTEPAAISHAPSCRGFHDAYVERRSQQVQAARIPDNRLPDGQLTFTREILSSPRAKNIPLCF